MRPKTRLGGQLARDEAIVRNRQDAEDEVVPALVADLERPAPHRWQTELTLQVT